MNHVTVAMFIPIVAIAGGIMVAIFRTHAQQRVAEWAMKERIAAIEKGIDPATLPPLPKVGDPEEAASRALSQRQRALELSQGLFIAGAITCFSGLGLAVLFVLLDVGPRNLWSVGTLAIFVGVGLLVAGGVARQGAAERPDLLPDRSQHLR
jgi:DMSO reductase anchor subunit